MDEHSKPLHWLLCRDEFYQEVQARLEDPNETDDGGYTLLHVAARSSDDNSLILKLLLDKGADVNYPTPNGHTPLHFAVCSRNRSTVSALIEAGAFVNSKDFLGRTALHFAIPKRLPNPPSPLDIITCDTWIIERLICHPEITPNTVDHVGDTPLMWAVKERHSNAVKALLKRGASPNIPNKDQRTPLHEALSGEIPIYDIVYTLLLNGAGIYSVDNSQQTPMDILVRNVRDAWTLSSASRCVWLIALRYHIRESLEHKLKQIPELYKYLNECCKEVKLMRELIIYDNVTLHDFALGSYQTRVGDPVREIYIPVVEVLLSGLCKKYFELIFSRLSVTHLHSVLEISTGSSLSLDLIPPDTSNLTIYDAIRRVYNENVELKGRLLRFKYFFMMRI